MIRFVLQVSKDGMSELFNKKTKKKLCFCTPNNDGREFTAVMGLLKEGGRITIEINQFKGEKNVG